jgi:hypothetical protein
MSDKEYQAIVEWWHEAFDLKIRLHPSPEIIKGLYKFWQLSKSITEQK